MANAAVGPQRTRRDHSGTSSKTTTPEKSDQQKARAAKGSASGRPPTFDTAAYKQRNTAERAINKLKTFRAVATRTDKREYVFQGTIDVASIKIWLRHPVNQDPPDPLVDRRR
ncbi:hypothetical protein [Pseudonocardia adelaidensis]|uniref:DDE family transposase n=1 Tax=Pseudonocardia adelaidensis TaxID=648754 RepID=A0ABP9NKA6_9PSEU